MSKKLDVKKEYIAGIVLSEALTEEVRALVSEMRATPESEIVRLRSIALLHEAVETNLNFYLLIPARQLKLNSIGIKLLNMGARTVLKLINSVGHKLAGKLTAKQMLFVADFIEEQLLAQRK